VQLTEKEGELLNFSSNIEQITALINHPKYSFSLHFPEKILQPEMIILYQRNVTSSIKLTRRTSPTM
jgi:hypothetical protein